MEEHHSWEDDKRLGFKNEVYSLVAASDMEDWFTRMFPYISFQTERVSKLNLYVIFDEEQDYSWMQKSYYIECSERISAHDVLLSKFSWFTLAY